MRGAAFLVVLLCLLPLCSSLESLPLKWEVEFTYEPQTKERVQNLLATRPNFATKILEKNSLFVDGDDQWFIYSVASDIPGAMLSANLCASLLRQNITSCGLIGFSPMAVTWWLNHTLPENAVVIPFYDEFDWCLSVDRFVNFRGLSMDINVFRYVQGIILARTFLFLDVLFEGINTWMLDGDITVESDPRLTFLSKDKDINVLINIGKFLQTGKNKKHEKYRAGTYSYPFLDTGGGKKAHATLNNGGVSSRYTQAARMFWKKEFFAMFNHEIGDPQHPFNQQLYEWGLVLHKNEDSVAFFEGVCRAPVTNEEVRIRGIVSSGPAGGPPTTYLVHAVGVSGITNNQRPKIDWLRAHGFWYLDE